MKLFELTKENLVTISENILWNNPKKWYETFGGYSRRLSKILAQVICALGIEEEELEAIIEGTFIAPDDLDKPFSDLFGENA